MKDFKMYAPFILALAVGYALAYFIHRCPDADPVPTVDIEAERLRWAVEMRSKEVAPLLDSLNEANVRIDSLRALQPKVVTRWRKVAVTNWELPDNEAAGLLVKRINERMP